MRLLAPAAPARALVGSGPGEVEEILPWDGPETAALLAGERDAGARSAPRSTRPTSVVAFTRSEPVIEALRARRDASARRTIPRPRPGGPHASSGSARALEPLALRAGADPPPPLVFSEDERREARARDSRPGRRLSRRSPRQRLARQELAGRALRRGWRGAWPAGGRGSSCWVLPRTQAGRDCAAGAVVAREWPLRVLGAALSRAGLFLGNDSGVAHLAAASGAPTLALFGPTDPALWSPVGRQVPLAPLARSAPMAGPPVGRGRCAGRARVWTPGRGAAPQLCR